LLLDISAFTTTGHITMDAKQPISPVSSAGIPSRVLYQLNGIICHYGYTHSFGHFVAYRRRPGTLARIAGPGEWLRISDADVSDVPESSVLGERGNAFLLFYEKISLPQEPLNSVSDIVNGVKISTEAHALE
jgi:ubiquitin C-terminal hydrolase